MAINGWQLPTVLYTREIVTLAVPERMRLHHALLITLQLEVVVLNLIASPTCFLMSLLLLAINVGVCKDGLFKQIFKKQNTSGVPYNPFLPPTSPWARHHYRPRSNLVANDWPESVYVGGSWEKVALFCGHHAGPARKSLVSPRLVWCLSTSVRQSLVSKIIVVYPSILHDTVARHLE